MTQSLISKAGHFRLPTCWRPREIQSQNRRDFGSGCQTCSKVPPRMAIQLHLYYLFDASWLAPLRWLQLRTVHAKNQRLPMSFGNQCHLTAAAALLAF